ACHLLSWLGWSVAESAELGHSGATRSRRCGCAEDLGEADSTCCSASSILPGGASPVMEGCPAPGTTYPHPSGGRRRREPTPRLPASTRSGTRIGWTGQRM